MSTGANQDKPVEWAVRSALVSIWDERRPDQKIEVRAPKIIEAIADLWPHGYRPNSDAVRRIGRRVQRGLINQHLDEGVAYAYADGLFTLRAVAS